MKKIIMSAALVLLLGLQMGCTPENNDKNDLPDPQDGIEEEAIIEGWDALVGDEAELVELVDYMDENISLLSKENASMIINQYEKAQKDNLPSFEEEFDDQVIQAEIFEHYMTNFNLDDMRNTENEALINLLKKADDTGYRVETAEGMFFPIIDYNFYNKYSSYVTEDMKSYIAIMIVESDEMPAKDAALVIGWDEVIDRAYSLEKFINEYPDSSRIEEIKALYEKYVNFTLYGLVNTPLFSHDSKIMKEEAKNIYRAEISNEEDSSYLKLLQDFMNILEENEYKLNEEVDRFIMEKLDNL
ncbi:MAG: hypothetical protein WC996_08545 [Peptostreptococcales bacterium]